MTRYLPPTVVCGNDECPMAGQCMRHMDYVEAKKTVLVLQTLNTSCVEVTADGCEYLHIPQKVMEARGFRKMYDSVPRRYSKKLWQSFPHCGSRRQFYRMLAGEGPLYPEEQQDILGFFAARGVDTTIGFDAMQEVMV